MTPSFLMNIPEQRGLLLSGLSRVGLMGQILGPGKTILCKIPIRANFLSVGRPRVIKL